MSSPIHCRCCCCCCCCCCGAGVESVRAAPADAVTRPPIDVQRTRISISRLYVRATVQQQQLVALLPYRSHAAVSALAFLNNVAAAFRSLTRYIFPDCVCRRLPAISFIECCRPGQRVIIGLCVCRNAFCVVSCNSWRNVLGNCSGHAASHLLSQPDVR